MSGQTNWSRVTHICVSNLTIVGLNNGLLPGRRQATIWTNTGMLLIGPLGTNFGEILIEIHTFSFKKTQLKIFSGKWRPFCLGLNVIHKHINKCKAVKYKCTTKYGNVQPRAIHIEKVHGICISLINALRPRQNCDIFKWIFSNDWSILKYFKISR